MLSEEFAETIIALKTKNKQEALDWILDMFIIWIGTLHKLEFTAEQIETALERIVNNNYDKFEYKDWNYTCIKDNNGKIMKPKWFKAVDLSDLIPKD
jgi:hypothetical protein